MQLLGYARVPWGGVRMRRCADHLVEHDVRPRPVRLRDAPAAARGGGVCGHMTEIITGLHAGCSEDADSKITEALEHARAVMRG